MESIGLFKDETNDNDTSKSISRNGQRDDFFFPFEPYPSQKQFMTSFLDVLSSNKKIGLFESPTGTGKTLMLLCTAMTYLINAFKGKKNKAESTKANDSNDWLSAFGKSPKQPLRDLSEELPNSRLNHFRHKIAQSMMKKDKRDKMLISNQYHPIKQNPIQSQMQTQKTQILFCTRTHSQIAQVIKEGKRIRDYYQSEHKSPFPFSFSILGSRKHLCINPLLTKLTTASTSLLNTKCKEMLEESKCDYCTQDSIDLLSKEIVNRVMDIEELAHLGKEISACPYFACRNSIESSDFIILPYNSLLNKTIRTNLNIALKERIIIFDEAHNIIESLLQSYTSEISFEMVISIAIGLILYYDMYSSRLKAENNLLIRQLITISEKVIEFIMTQQSDTSKGDCGNVIQLNDFSIKTNTTSYDLFKLIKFIEEVELKEKLQWTIEHFVASKKTIDDMIVIIKKNGNLKTINLSQGFLSPQGLLKEIISKDAMSRFALFLNGLTNINEDGIVIINNSSASASVSVSDRSKYPQLKYQMINPIREFKGIITEAKCVIFAGGTMKPFDDFKPLFTSVQSNLIETYEGDHVISSDALVVHILQSNPFDQQNQTKNECIQFTYDKFKQKQETLIEMMLKTIEAYLNELNSASSIGKGKGIAVFVSSYDLLSKLIAFNTKAHVIDKAVLFYEKNNSDEPTFELYKDTLLENHINSVIIAVIGGKLSEGINFNDDLARIVLIFGLPYPNIHSVEIKQKMMYYDRLFKQKAICTNGNEYYENICIKAVNQSIGRAIRHSKDYAAIVLFDWRYTKENIIAKLPKWLKKKEMIKISNREQFKDSLKQLIIFLSKDH